MIECSIDEILAFHAQRDGSYAPAVRLSALRELRAKAVEAQQWKAEAERLAAELAALRGSRE